MHPVDDYLFYSEEQVKEVDAVPHFDFDKPPSETRPPDIDEVKCVQIMNI